MNKTQVVEYANIGTDFPAKEPAIIVSFPNYEDRTKGIINTLYKHTNPAPSGCVEHILFCLKNRVNNNPLLEELKERNIDSIKSVLENANVHEYWLEYPSNFSPNALKAPIKTLLETMLSEHKDKANILFDISTTPKSILFHLCESIKEFLQLGLVGRIFFAYCLPENYSRVPYAQDIGLIKGLFSGEALQIPSDKDIHVIVIPSRSGHEGKLLCDTIDSASKKASYSVYFPIYIKNYIDSLNVLQANQSLVDRESYFNYFYCTLDDAIKTIDELFQKEYARIKHIIDMKRESPEDENAPALVPQVYLVAPFGSKVILPVAYFELLRLRSIDPDLISIEIANVKGFQYTSTYSLGGDGGEDGKKNIDITCFELNGGFLANDKDSN